MKFSILLTAAGVASATNTCTGASHEENGNWFCSMVTKIKYDHVGGSGTFQTVTNMANGVCSKTGFNYNGNLAPLDEDLSVHIRGPFNLKVFAAYTLGPSSKKRDVPPSHDGHHNHQQFHNQLKEKRASNWVRNSFYNSDMQVADNTVFLGNYGGIGSGVWDTNYGNSLAYLSADGSTGSASSQILKNVLIPSNKEFSIWSGQKCDGSCGYSRANDVAYKGFGGGSKVFMFKFNMPLDGNRGFNGDMPALWLLNGKIPRTQQYGGCSCWATNCGEVDIYEVLASGDTKCKSTLHMQNGLGSSDYFDRPTGGLIRVAVVFDQPSSTVTIVKLPDAFTFDPTISAATVAGWIA
ncbi:hypothetical protein G7046_g1148 [Stylonectria norvegica]|nr:hypothetical protein G7046_g1148 [Stylonectria norvegica]